MTTPPRDRPTPDRLKPQMPSWQVMLREAEEILREVRDWHGNTPGALKARIDAWLKRVQE